MSAGTELKEFIDTEVASIQRSLKSLTTKVTDKVVKIKLSEVLRVIVEHSKISGGRYRSRIWKTHI